MTLMPKLNTMLFLALLGLLNTQAVQSASFDALFESKALVESKDGNQQLENLTQRLELGDSASGKFTQYRQLKVLKKPLVSQGLFAFDTKQGLIWQQTQPFSSSLILKDDELIQVDSSGHRQMIKASESQGAGALAETMPTLLKALLSGNISALNQQFTLYLVQSSPDTSASDIANSWQLGLVPKDPLMHKVIPQMVLEGDAQLTSLTLLSGNGDTSRIEFEQINSEPLSEEMQQLLSPHPSVDQADNPESHHAIPKPLLKHDLSKSYDR
ncbi:outer membrane lipoprotein carrier protein LolA [Shewanella sp. D64]|uniref:outer membrane lipoprotein carrier protein LolA n=1 Tax=unclassified Shewanella TaxID=196818 RepID=UPI0022BA1523|nr:MULTISPECIES: outer membrane lipoprotein carrier protein LolA [unclassified Shewanella]MEC4726857.1 outer membrane lipoprotein carrier protein LolA [Shewanella sp. D64]MEC4739031.1 outer membrane lipoprotein carrier protein LolA [Shewanella sp. E94]WBJ95890.1 outer membrane lipoprotein carrier protein LolA [Shewanella sp. MTB7]